MNNRIKELADKASQWVIDNSNGVHAPHERWNEKFAELIVEAVLDQVKERAYYTGDRDWSDMVDRPWIQLEFGYGSLHDAKSGIFK